MKDTHRPVPIPAYDVNGSLIAPVDYCRRLECALAQVDFTLSHWSIWSKEECWIVMLQIYIRYVC
jgi:hypothetical protein